VVDALQPDTRAARAELVFKARLSDQRHHVFTNPTPPPGRVLRDQPLDAGALPVSPPLPGGWSRQPTLPARRLDAVLPGVLNDGQSLLYPQPISSRIPCVPSIAPPVERPMIGAPRKGLVPEVDTSLFEVVAKHRPRSNCL
jgi:hypothetical protein